jgi:hypothetical protein
MNARLKEYSFVLSGYFLATLLFTYPLVICFTTYLAGDGNDTFSWIWNFWWMKKALLELKINPFYTDYLFYPFGESLIYHAFTPLYGLLSIPLQFVFSQFVVYNILFVFNFVITGLSMYLLLRYLTKNKMAAFLGGCLVAFCPFRTAHAYGHFHLLAMEWLPLYLLFSIKIEETKELKYVMLAGLMLALTAVSSLYFLAYEFLFTAFYIIYVIVRRKKIFPLFRALSAIAVAAIILFPLIMMVFRYPPNGLVGTHSSEVHSADLLSFFLPGDILSLGYFFRTVTNKFTCRGVEDSCYLGYVVIGLSLFAIGYLWRKEKNIALFTFLGFLFFLLSLGPLLHVKGQITKVPLPTLILDKYLGYSFGGCPVRIHIMTVICLSILSSYAIKEILNRHSWRMNVLLVGLIIMSAIEFLALPFPVAATVSKPIHSFFPPRVGSAVQVPEFYKMISNDKQDYCLLDLANGAYYSYRYNPVLYYQTIHNKKLIGGMLSRSRKFHEQFYNDTAVIRDILLNQEQCPLRCRSGDYKKRIAEGVLNYYNIKYVVVPKPDRSYPKSNLIPLNFGLCQVFEDDLITVYTVCEQPMSKPLRNVSP